MLAVLSTAHEVDVIVNESSTVSDVTQDSEPRYLLFYASQDLVRLKVSRVFPRTGNYLFWSCGGTHLRIWK